MEEIRALEDQQRELLRKRKMIKSSLEQIQFQGRNLGIFPEDNKKRKKLIIQDQYLLSQPAPPQPRGPGSHKDLSHGPRQENKKKKLWTAVDVEEKTQEAANSAEQKTEVAASQQHSSFDEEAQRKRSRNLFGNIMGHLKKAKETLDSEKSRLKQQQNNFDRIDEKQESQAREIREKQRVEIEEKRAVEFKKKLELERSLLKMDQDILLKKLDIHYGLLSHNLLTKTQPPLFWRPVKPLTSAELSLAATALSQVSSTSNLLTQMKETHVQTAKSILEKVKSDSLEFMEARYGQGVGGGTTRERGEEREEQDQSRENESNQSVDEQEAASEHKEEN